MKLTKKDWIFIKKIEMKTMNNLKTKTILVFFLLSKASICLLAQVEPAPPPIPGKKIGSLGQLIQEKKLLNFKSGLIPTCVRGDTVFAVFYMRTLNDLKCVPLGVLGRSTKFWLPQSTDIPLFRRLRETSGSLMSRNSVNDCLDGENLILFEQTLSFHITAKKAIEGVNYARRMIYYRFDKGVYKIVYSMGGGNMRDEFIWPYETGDFIFK